MHLLDYFYTNAPTISNFAPRKLNLPDSGSFILRGVRGSGKSALIIDYLNNQNSNYLYIDCQDPAFIFEEIDINILNEYIKEEGIEILVLDHYFKGFLEALPIVDRVIFVTKEDIDFNLPIYHLYPLDFEEFLNFKNSSNTQSAFSLYTKFGSLPKIANSNNYTLNFKELFFEKFDEQEGKVLLILSLFQGKITTSHQIYQRAKESFKISKDWLYKTIKNFINEEVLFTIDTLEAGIGKKHILYDFAFSKYLNKNQPFITTFDALVALALIKHKFKIKAISNPLGYILEDEIILIAPFNSEDNMWTKIQNQFGLFSQLKKEKVTILTLNLNYSFTINNISFNAIPFYEWVVGL